MISLLPLLLAGQLLLPDPPVRPRVFRSDGAERVTRLGSDDYAFFEAFPASGAGAGSVAPYPNWAAQSGALNDATWVAQFSPTAITVTANATGTMERLQIPATSGAAQYALLYQPVATTLAGNVTIFASVQGVGGSSGSFKLGAWNGSTFTYGDCSFTGTLSTCSVTVNLGSSPTATRIYMGNDSANIVGNPAQAAVDVYVGSVQLNVGSTAAPYIATTTAAAGYMPTGAKGEALTFSRTGTAMATRTASGGLATTGIANGDLVLMPANQPRVEYDSAGTLGLLVESARTNSVLRSQELANGVWVALGAGGAAAPTVTATYATGPDNGTTATRLQVNACAGASQASVVYQNYTGTAAATMGSLFLRGTSMSGTVNVYFYDTTAGTGNAVQCSFTSDSWTRCAPVSKTFANTTHRIGVGCLNDAVITGSTNTGAVDVLAYGMQSEAGTYLTSYIPTTSAAVTRNEEAADFAVSLSPTAGVCVASSLNYPSLSVLASGASTMGPMLTTGAAGAALGATYLWPYSSAVNGALAVDTGGVISAGNAFYQPGVAATAQGRYLVRHSGGVGNWTGCTNASCSTQGTTSTWGTPAFTRVKVDRATAAAANATAHIISRIQIDPVSTRCSP